MANHAIGFGIACLQKTWLLQSQWFPMSKVLTPNVFIQHGELGRVKARMAPLIRFTKMNT